MSFTPKPSKSAATMAAMLFATAALSGCGGDDKASASAGGGTPAAQRDAAGATTPGGRGPGNFLEQLDTAALAKKLGVKEAELKAALEKAQQAMPQPPQGGGQPPQDGQPPEGAPPQGERPDGAPPQGERPDGEPPRGARGAGFGGQLAETLAKELDLDKDKVQQALLSVMPERGTRPPGATPGESPKRQRDQQSDGASSGAKS